jgi:adenylate cyclase
MRVIARHSAFSYKGRSIKVQQVGQELGVRHLVEGSVRKAGARVRVTAQLVDCRDGSQVWAERFDRDLTDIFAIQDEITRAIVERLKVKLLPEEKRSIAQPPTQNIEAYNFYLRGRELSRRRSKRCLQLAREMFVKAAALDPNYARAYAGIAICDSFLSMTYHVNVSIDGILELAGNALALDDKLAEAHAARAVAFSAAARYDEAQAAFEEALRLDPNGAETCYFYARSSVVQGKHQLAAEMFERATAADPDDYQSPCLLKMVYIALHRTDDAKRAASIGLERSERELARHPDDSRPAQLGAGAAVALGDKERARELIARALTLEPDDLVAQFNAACVYALIGESDHSLDLLERCLPRLGSEKVEWAKQDSDFESVRDHPRFQKLFDSIAAAGATDV